MPFYNKRPSDRQGAPRGGGSAPERELKGDGTPFLREISAINMERYIDAVHQYALTHYAIVAPWLRGQIPKVMLEHKLPRDKANLLGRLAKLHILPDGSRSTVNITAAEVRKLMIQEIIDEDKAASGLVHVGDGDSEAELGLSSMVPEGSPRDSKTETPTDKGRSRSKDSKTDLRLSLMVPEGSPRDTSMEIPSDDDMPNPKSVKAALKSAFPTNSAKTRETERSNLGTAAANLLGKMLFSWPIKDIQIKMQASPALMKAFDNTDVIRFLEELRVFSLEGSGNPEINREAAEAYLVSLQMKPKRVLEYIKEFTEAVEHIRVCKSTFTEFKIVDLFFRHIDQKAFPDWYIKFLSEDEQLFRFQKLTFDDAKEHALNYHNKVIRFSELANVGGKELEDQQKVKTINSVRHLKSALSGTGPTSGPITVSQTVLVTLLGNKRKLPDSSKDNFKEVNKTKPNVKAESKEDTEKGQCFAFRDKGTCKFGSSCHFAHTP